jgi:cytochrome c biogenesis protein CcmG/thiol:disulfide interchange protein DsbE
MRERVRLGKTTAVLALSVGLMAGCASASAAPAPGRAAPAFELPELGGNRSISLASLLQRHEPIVLNAWASWCDPCKKETPLLVQAAKQYKGKVLFVGVNMTDDDSVADAGRFVRSYHIPYLTLADVNGEFSKAYHIEGYPTTFFIDRDGKVLHIDQGQLNKDDLQAMIEQALSGS